MKRKLGEICRIVSGSTPKTGIPEYWDGNLKWITPAELDDESRTVNDTKRTITELGAIKTGLTPLPAGTVLLSSRAPIGKVAITGCEMYCNQGFKNLICSDLINNEYLYWFLKGKTQCLKSLGRGATFKEISKTIVADIEINLPDIEEQEKIVNCIKKIDSRLFMLRAEISRLDELIKARFVEMFGGIDRYISIKDSGLFIADGNYSSKYPRSSEFTSFGVPFIRANNIKDNTVVDDDMYFISPEKHDELKKGHILHGDILVTTRGNIGQLGIVPQKHNNSNINAQIVLLRCRDTKYLPEYLLFALQTVDVKKQFIRQQTGTALKQLPVKHLEKISFIDAPIELQNQFAAFVAQVDKSKFALSNELAMGNFYIRLIHDCIMHGCIDL